MVLLKTFGHLDYPSNLYYVKGGLSIEVERIGSIKYNTVSSWVEVELEKSVSYPLRLKPQSEGFEFEPEEILYLGQKIQKFRIKHLNNTKPGNYYIKW